MVINGVRWDWSYMANDEEDHALDADEKAPTEFALMANTSAESKNKEGLGYSVVPPPPAQIYSSPKKDLSWTGLPEFADDTVIDYSRPSPTMESTSGDDQNRNPSVPETNASPSTITPQPFIKFVKPNDSPSKSKTGKTETPKKPPVKYAEQYKKPNKKLNGSSHNNIDDKGYWESGCYRHMTGNISYLSDYEPFDGGYVSFGQGGCKITGKGTIKTGKLEFENVYFVKDLKEPKGPKSENGGEFKNKKMTDFCSQKWIKREFSNARTPQQNNVAERRNWKLIEAARTMRVEENLHVEFLENKSIEKGTKDATSQEVKKDVSSLRYIALPNWAHDALLESSSSKPQDHCSTEVPESSGNTNLTASTSNPPADQIETLTVESPIPTSSNQVETPSLDNILTLTNRFEDILQGTTNSDESNGVEADIFDALQDPSRVEAMQEELLQFKIQNVWTLVDCPKGVRPIGTKWVLKNKKDERWIVIRNKARLVAQRHTQEEGIEYDEVFALVVRIEAIRLFLAYALFMGFTVYQMDVKSAFLYGTINEEVGTIDQNLFIRRQRGDFILVQVYVDEIIFRSSNTHLCREFEALMHEKFQMSAMGELNFFLGLQVIQKEDGIFFSQDKYLGDILKKFGYSDVRSSITPMEKENPWGKDRTGKDIDLHLYRSMIGSLMYLTASRPDIMFAVCACARHQVRPIECHLHAVKRIFRYLKGHPKLGLWYLKESPFDLVAYSDSDYGGSLGLKSHVEDDAASTNPDWCQLDDLIKMWIISSLCDPLQDQVVTTPGTMTINEYCTKIRSMAGRLKNLGCDVSDKSLVMYTVNGLDSRFATLVDIIRHRKTLPSFETTRNMLLLKESSFKDDTRTSSTFNGSSSSPTALVTSTSSTPKGSSSKSPTLPQLCNHFNKGTCHFGDRYKYIHDHRNRVGLSSTRNQSRNTASSHADIWNTAGIQHRASAPHVSSYRPSYNSTASPTAFYDFWTRHILFRCDSLGDLYPVTKPSPLPTTFVTTSSSTWHQRLGHPRDDVLRTLST
nr:hypothetical protein [Tanacetum cinerariifolium]